MAQRSKKENYDALGSIFDFIFKEAKKSPEKRRPIKPTGISGESMLTDALAASLEMPGAFITNNIIDEFNDMLDIKLADFKLDDQTKVSISSNNVIDFLRDPNTFIQKQIDRGKGVRKANRIRFLGEVMDDYLTTAWAHQYGDLEAKEIALARAGINENSEKYKVNRAVGQNIRLDTLSNSDFTRDRSIELIGRKTFGKRWDSMGEQEKFEFMDRLTETGPTIFKNPKTGKTDVSKDWGGGVASESVQEYLVQRYGREEAKNFSLATHSRKGTDKIDLSNSELYRTLETDYLDGKVEALKDAPSGTEEEKKRKIYEKSRLMVNLRNENQLNNLKKALEQETDADKKVEIEKAIQLGEMARRALGDRNNFLAPLGKIEGWVDSINRVYGGILAPNLVVSVLKGDFFDARKNTFLCPTTSGKAGGVDIIKAKEGKNKFTNTYNKMSETIYYLTPKAALRTLFFNGEGFAFLLSKQLESLQDIQGLSQKELLGKFNDKLTNKDFDAFMKTTLIKMKASGISAKDLARIEATLKKAKGLQNLINIFSWPSKFKSAIESSINKVLVRNRARFARILLKNKSLRNWMIKSGAGKLLGTWITQGGLKTLVRSLVTAIAGAAGLVLTPLGSAFVTAVTWVLTDLIIKLGKLLTTVGMLFALGVIGIFVLMVSLGSGSVRKWQKEVYSYTHVIPSKVEICPDYGFTEPTPENPEDDYEEEDVVMPPLTGEKCILGISSGVSCTQGWVNDGTCFSHANISGAKPVDLAFSGGLYAPQFCGKPGTSCKVTSSANYSCKSPAGDYVKFEAFDGTNTYTFLFVHVKLNEELAIGSELEGDFISADRKPIAAVLTSLPTGACWTGPHLHLEMKMNGSAIDPLAVLQSFGCGVPSLSGCNQCN